MTDPHVSGYIAVAVIGAWCMFAAIAFSGYKFKRPMATRVKK